MINSLDKTCQVAAPDTNLVSPTNHSKTASDKRFETLTYAYEYIFADGGEVVGVEVVHDAQQGGRIRSDQLGRYKSPEECEREACRRAEAMIRRRARAAGLRKLWTLTFPGTGVHDFARASEIFREWMKRYGSEYFNHKWLAVPELHPGGHGWHWHILAGDYADVNLIRRSWTSWLARYGLLPSGKAEWVRVHVQREKSARVAARYIAKYVSKTIGKGIPKGWKRYYAGSEAKPPKPARVWIDIRSVVKVIEEIVASKRGLELYVWTSEGMSDWTGPPAFRIEW